MSTLTLLNQTRFVAQYVVMKGEQIIARLPGIEPGAQISIPTNATYEVIATTVIDGNTYTSAPQSVQRSMGFVARVLQVRGQGTYVFDVQQIRNEAVNKLTFQKTCLSPVTFTISKDGVAVQNVVVPDSFQVESLDISDIFYVYAVVNGVTTETYEFANPNATITAVTDDSVLDNGYVSLVVS